MPSSKLFTASKEKARSITSKPGRKGDLKPRRQPPLRLEQLENREVIGSLLTSFFGVTPLGFLDPMIAEAPDLRVADSRQTRGVPSRQPGLSNLASSYQGSEAGHGFAPKREPGSAAGSSHPPETNQYLAASAPSSDNTRLDAGLFGILGNSLDSGLDPLASHSALRAPQGFASAGAGESQSPSGASAGGNSPGPAPASIVSGPSPNAGEAATGPASLFSPGPSPTRCFSFPAGSLAQISSAKPLIMWCPIPASPMARPIITSPITPRSGCSCRRAPTNFIR